ncbi:HrpE/YscL family type III secretion apparatus protein [Labrys sp. KNU-23]|uniref:type III secretion system stator protein SctL n=1 Tax=Labrys sp. KNU-23 TaxID=2789216 RepID=UPI0011EDE147|nr:type III secretion system stator protein SctL [Labrys sp. KNU-23]QEN85330.1 HrpE/YscL family type III secretion apparatus protein [Labrys sp. KNU-23]
MAGQDTGPLADRPKRPTGRILRAAEAKAWQDGYGFLETARQDAGHLREAGRRAYAAEYAQGYEDGLAEGKREAARLLTETTVKLDRYIAGVENQVTDLVLEVTRRMLGSFDLDELVAKIARQAVAEVRQAKYLRLTVHPDAYDRVREELDLLGRERQFDFAIETATDSTLARDACIVASEAAVVDASVGTQLDAIAAALGSTRKAAS